MGLSPPVLNAPTDSERDNPVPNEARLEFETGRDKPVPYGECVETHRWIRHGPRRGGACPRPSLNAPQRLMQLRSNRVRARQGPPGRDKPVPYEECVETAPMDAARAS